jgi:hypothetical protein
LQKVWDRKERAGSTGASHPARSQRIIGKGTGSKERAGFEVKQKNLIQPARAGAAGITAGPTWAATVAGEGRAFLATAHGKPGNLLVQLLALALGASGMLSVEDDALEMVVTLAANVFKNRHGINIIRTNLTTGDTDFTDPH